MQIAYQMELKSPPSSGDFVFDENPTIAKPLKVALVSQLA